VIDIETIAVHEEEMKELTPLGDERSKMSGGMSRHFNSNKIRLVKEEHLV